MRVCRIVLVLLFVGVTAYGQLPVEILVGHQRTSADAMWFRYFKNAQGNNSRFLFFNRSRASSDYSNKTAFGVTLAASYNFPSGLGLVAVGQFLGDGFYPKAGVQYFRRKNQFMFFTWLVSETQADPSMDWFVLTRFEPSLTEKVRLFSQLELLSTSDLHGYYQLVQRLRLGVGFPTGWQFGAGLDLQSAGSDRLATTHNLGVFIRKEFQ